MQESAQLDRVWFCQSAFPESSGKTTELVQRFWGRTRARDFSIPRRLLEKRLLAANDKALFSADPYVSISITAVEAPKGQTLTGC
jgi:hypothetical protein